MIDGVKLKMVTVAALVALASVSNKAEAAQCGNTSAGFETWKQQFASEATGKGVSASTVAAFNQIFECNHRG